MVDTISAQYSLPLANKNGYILYLPNVDDSGALLQRPDPDPLSESKTQLFPLGTRLERGECVWRYCENASVPLNISEVVQAAASVHAEAEDDIAVGTTGEIGKNTITLTSTGNLDDSPADEYGTYNEGYIFVNNGNGEGQCRKIKDCEAFNSGDPTIVTTYEDWTIEVTSANGTCGIYQNPFKNVIIHAATGGSGVAIGVPGIPVSADYFFWAQTKGPQAVMNNTSLALGTAAIAGTTAGNVDPSSAATVERPIGFPLAPGFASTEQTLINLIIDK